MLSSPDRKVQYDKGAGWLTSPSGYAIPFKYWAKAELAVVLSYDDGTPDLPLVLSTDYTLTDPADTGTLTRVSTWDPAATRLTIYRTVEVSQETDYRDGEAIPANTIETNLDRITAMVQETNESIDRTVTIPMTDPAGVMEIPSYIDRASKFLAFDAAGDPIASDGSGTPCTAAWAAVLDDATIPAGLTTMGFSALMQALRDDTTAAAAFATLSQSQIPNVFYDDYASGVDPTTVHGTAEFIEAATIDCISSKGMAPEQAPYPKLITYEPPYLGTIDMAATQSPWATPLPRTKWAGRGVVGVFPATTNLVGTADDLIGWSATSANITPFWDDVLKIPMAKIAKTAGSASAIGYYYLGVNALTVPNGATQAILKKGTAGTTTSLYMYDATAGQARMAIDVVWATHTVTLVAGTAGTLSYEWLDTDTVWVAGCATGGVGGNNNQVRVYPDSSKAGSAGDYCWAARVQYENLTLPTKYTPSARAAGTLKYHWPMPASGTIAFWFRPTGYGGATATAAKYLFSFIEYAKTGGAWYSNNALYLSWNGSANTVSLTLNDSGGVARINGVTDNTWTLAANTWAHIAITWSGLGGASGAVTVYVNGVAKATHTLTGLALSNFAAGAASKLIIGSDGAENAPAVPGYQANALFTDILLDSTAWSAAEILAHVTANKPWLNKDRVVSAQPGFRLDRYGNLTAKRVFNEIGELGSVVESGSNANGTYIKYSDGTLWCFQRVTVSSGTPAAWTFPHKFVTTYPYCAAIAESSSASALLSIAQPTSAAVTLYSQSASSFAAPIWATGRWKA